MEKMNRPVACVLAVLFAVFLAACPIPQSSDDDDLVGVTSVTIDKNELNLTVGDIQQLSVTVSPADADDKSVTWSSSATDIAAVSDSGLVTALAVGTATITVKTNDGAKEAICAVTVVALSAPSDLSYSTMIGNYVVGTPIENIIPTVSGSVSAYSISPDLPAGLSLDATTGVISGTPTAVSPLTPYTITAANDAGSTTTQIGIVVYATAGATVTGTVILPMSVSDVSYVVVADTDHSGDNGGQAAWAIGTVTGSSFVYTMENVPAGTYNFYAIIYVSGSMMMGAPSEDELTTSDSTFVDISGTGSYVVNRVCYSRLPPADNADYFWYPSFSRSLVLGTPVSDFTPTFPFDWEITSYSIDTDSWGALPAGLTLDGATGAITGTPTEAWDSTLYVIDVEYEHGTALTAIRLNVSPTTGATINGTVTLPVSVTGKPYLVVVDTDDDMTNGGYASVAAGSVTGSSFEYWIENVPDGDFVVYAAVFDVSDIWLLSDISPGDYLSDEGTLVTVDGPDTYMADRSCSLIE